MNYETFLKEYGDEKAKFMENWARSFAERPDDLQAKRRQVHDLCYALTERHKAVIEGKREEIAKIQHNIWSSWMIYMFGKCVVNQFGDWIIPKDLVVRWQRQMHTAYADLPEGEKQSDRDVLDEHGVVDAIIRALEEPADETD